MNVAVPERWMTPDDLSRSAGEAGAGSSLARAASMLGWMETFLCRPLSGHPAGRLVCPGLPESSAARLLFIDVLPLASVAEDELLDAIVREADDYLAVRRALPPSHRPLLGLLVVLPDLDPSAHPLLDRVKHRLAPRFDEEGLAARGFYPGHPDPSLHNPHVRVADSPVAAFGIRSLLSHDGAPFEDLRARGRDYA